MSRRRRSVATLVVALVLSSAVGGWLVLTLPSGEELPPPLIHENLPSAPGPGDGDPSGRITETLANATSVLGSLPPTLLEFRGSVKLGDELYLTINASRPSYWRLTAFETYLATGWRRDPALAVVEQGTILDGSASGGTLLLQRVGIESGLHYALAGAWQPHRAWLNWTEPANQSRSLGLDSAGGLISLVPLRPGDHYTFLSSLFEPTPAELRAAGVPLQGAEDYLVLPPTLPDRVRSLAQNLTAGLSSPYERMLALQSYLRGNLSFSLVIVPAQSPADPVDHFLFEERRGYSTYFASALAVFGRAVGIPTRLAVGYLPGVYLPTEGLYVVGSRHAHAWTELLLEGVGWVPLDPTPPDSQDIMPGPTPEPPARLPKRIPTVTEITQQPGAVLPEEEFVVRGVVRSRGGWPVGLSELRILLNTSKALPGIEIGRGASAANGSFAALARVAAANLRGAFELVATSEGTLIFGASWSDPILRVLRPTHLTLMFAPPSWDPILRGQLVDEELRPVIGEFVDLLVNRHLPAPVVTDSEGRFALNLTVFLAGNTTDLNVTAVYPGDPVDLLLGPSWASLSVNTTRALPVVTLVPLKSVVTVQDASVEVVVNISVDGAPAPDFPFSLLDRRTNLSLGSFSTDASGQTTVTLPVPQLSELGPHLLQAEVAASLDHNEAAGVGSYNLVAPTLLEVDLFANRTSIDEPYVFTGKLTAVGTPVVNGELVVRSGNIAGPKLAVGRSESTGRFRVAVPLGSLGPGERLFAVVFADPSLATRYLPSDDSFVLFLFVPTRLSFVSFPFQVLHGAPATYNLTVDSSQGPLPTGAVDALVEGAVVANVTVAAGGVPTTLSIPTANLTVADQAILMRYWPVDPLYGSTASSVTLRIVATVLVTLEASSRHVVPGGNTQLLGTLSSEGRGLAFFPVAVVLIVDATEERIANAVTDEAGRFALRWAPSPGLRGSVEIVALFESKANYLSGTSEPVRILIAPHFWTSPWFVAGMGALAILGVLAATYGRSLWTSWRTRREALGLPALPFPEYVRPGTNGEVARIYAEVLRHLATRGVPFDPAATPAERWHALIARADPRGEPFGTLTRLFERAFYAPWPIAPAQVSEARRLSAILQKLPGGVLAG